MIKYFFKRYSSRKIVLFIGDSLCIIIAILIALSFTFNVNTIKFVNPFSNLLKIILYISVSFVTLFAFRYLSLYKERTYFSGNYWSIHWSCKSYHLSLNWKTTRYYFWCCRKSFRASPNLATPRKNITESQRCCIDWGEPRSLS